MSYRLPGKLDNYRYTILVAAFYLVLIGLGIWFWVWVFTR